MGRINGTLGQLNSHFDYYIDWTEDQINEANNTSRVRAWVYVLRNGAYYVEGIHNDHDLYIDGTKFEANPNIDMNPENGPHLIVSGTKIVTHNSDGSKSINISSNGQVCAIAGATYSPQSGAAGATVTLSTIPREAYIESSNANFTIGTNPTFSIKNDGDLFCQIQLYVDNVLVKSFNAGTPQGNYTPPLGTTDYNNIYSKMVSETSDAIFWRVKTFTNSNYNVQVGNDRDKNATVYINTPINKPTFTNFVVSCLDKTITVQDKYNNTLATSSTATLTGGSDKVIKGYSKVRATIGTGDKAVAKNYANMSKYRMIVGSQSKDVNYSASALNIDIDNTTSKSTSITATDSRNLSTTVSKSLSLLVEYFAINLYNFELVRDNGVDPRTKLKFSGKIWNKYFSTNTTSGGTAAELNSGTYEWRYKLETESWGAQSWNAITPSVDASGNITFDEYIDGDLGALGFDSEKNFTIEVRAYDKLSHDLTELKLNVGTPLLFFSRRGTAVNKRFNEDIGGSFQVDGILDLHRQIQPVAFVPSMEDNWVNHNAKIDIDQWTIPCYYRDVFGFTHLEGLIKSGTVGGSAKMFILPDDYRPTQRTLMGTLTNTTNIGRLDVSASNGYVIPYSGGNGWFNLSGLYWPTFTEGWHLPVFEDGWQDYSNQYDFAAQESGYNYAGYHMDELGFVHLKGLVKSGTTGSGATIFTLPEGYRPPFNMIFPTRTNAGRGEIRVLTDGRVVPQYASSTYTTLDGIYFMSADSPYWDEWVEMDYGDGFEGYGGDFGQAMEWIDPTGVWHMCGLIRNEGDKLTNGDIIVRTNFDYVDKYVGRRAMFKGHCNDSSFNDIRRFDIRGPKNGYGSASVTINNDFGGAPDGWLSISGFRKRLEHGYRMPVDKLS